MKEYILFLKNLLENKATLSGKKNGISIISLKNQAWHGGACL